MKTCSKCKQAKPVEAFAKAKKSKDGLRWRCRECLKQERIEAGPEKQKNFNLRRYGLTIEQFREMLLRQENKCASCGEPVREGKGRGCAHVDHNHITGKVRGILCAGCNVGIGHLGTLRKILLAARYFKKVSS